MIEDQAIAQRKALMAVLKTAKKQGVDVDALCDKAVEALKYDPGYGSAPVTEAIEIIKRAIDALEKLPED